MAKSNSEARLRVRKRDGWQCRYCRCRVYNSAPWWGKAWLITIDHVRPLSRNGQEAVENMVVSCQACNETKSSESWTPKPLPVKPIGQMKWPGDVKEKRPSHHDLALVMKEDDRVRNLPHHMVVKKRQCPTTEELEQLFNKAV